MNPFQNFTIPHTGIFLFLNNWQEITFSIMFLIPIPYLWIDHNDIIQTGSNITTSHTMPPGKIILANNHVITIVTKSHYFIFLSLPISMQQDTNCSQTKLFGQYQVRLIVIQLFPVTPTERSSSKTEQFLQINGSKLETSIDFLIIERLVTQVPIP